MKKRYLLLILLVLSSVSVFVGVTELGPGDLWDLNSEQQQVLLISRIPRLISIIVTGASLSIAGVIMQQLTGNKFVSPTTAGTMDFARLGILVAMFLFASSGPLTKMSVAFLFALGGTFLFMKILDHIRYKDTIFVPLVGLMLGNIISSLATFFAYQNDLIQNISSWLIGDFSMIIKGRYEFIYLSIPMLILAYLFANRFTIAGMGESFAKNLGLNYRQVVQIGLIIVAFITASVIITVGVIPFLGLIVPNIVSIFRGDHLKKNLPHTALLGANFLLFCDILG
ncbi:MAG: iron chelate uptake ABC transporter family permease subunit, partial [Caldibacillus sp.]